MCRKISCDKSVCKEHSQSRCQPSAQDSQKTGNPMGCGCGLSGILALPKPLMLCKLPSSTKASVHSLCSLKIQSEPWLVDNVLVFNPLSFVQVKKTGFLLFLLIELKLYCTGPRSRTKVTVDPFFYIEYFYLEEAAGGDGTLGKLRQEIVSSRPGWTTE